MRPVVVLAFLALLALVACAGQTSTPFEEAKTPFERLLSLVPDTTESRQLVWLNDYVMMREVYGLSLPSSDDDVASLADYVRSLRQQARPAAAPWISGYFDHAGTIDLNVTNLMFLQYLGFNAYGVEQSAWAGQSPSLYEVLLAAFDPESTDDALATCPDCPEPFRVEYKGAWFYSWGKDFSPSLEKRNAPPAFDPAGRGGRILVGDDHVIRTLWTDGMMSAIETQAGLRPSLADAEEFRLLVRGLGELDAYSALLTEQVMCITNALTSYPGGYGITKETLERLLEENTSRLLRPYQAFAIGVGKDEVGRYMAVAVVHEDAESAAENVAMLQKRIDETESWRLFRTWADAADGVEITSEGRLLLAKLRGDWVSHNWSSVVIMPDPLLMTEDRACEPPAPLTPTAAPTPAG